ncbi:hypothetical protein SAMN05660690_0144 [Geodermatophilus telluris]|uniref:Uncharacterized protein n=1 Tax=Geodermatophilus telluris TaxID=1190417 RepID=A0A1G6I1B5_9ACTN|nr:hypothetical protein [Geodermatophilus telluris]SDC00349.1 hypothetical protein SAMN05660690_0144 [Geodermatophilus telluris]
MNGALKAAWGLTVFVVLVGIVGWALSGEAFFAVFLVLGLVTAVGAWLTGRSTTPKGDPRP